MAEVLALRTRGMQISRPDVVLAVERLEQPVYPGAKLSTAKLCTLANIVAGEAFAVEALLLKGRRRGARRLAHARTVAMALVHLVCGRSQEDVARCFGGRNRTTASHHMEMVEWLNDVPQHDAFWDLAQRRFELLIQLTEMPSLRQAWVRALGGLDDALQACVLEGEALYQARHVVDTFWEERGHG